MLFRSALPGLLVAQTPADKLRAADSAWARSYATHDTVLAGALFSDDLVVTSTDGTRKNKLGELADVRPYPGLKMHYFRTTGVEPRIYEKAAVVTGIAEWEFTMNNQVRTMRRAYTAFYIPGGTLGWRMVALHLGNAPAPAAN